MHKVNTAQIVEVTWASPKGKFIGAGKEVSEELGRKPESTDLNERHIQPQTFERSLRAFSQRVPFQPFAVELLSGSRITVDHPGALVFRGGLAVYIALDGTPSLFNHEGVSQLSEANRSRSKAE